MENLVCLRQTVLCNCFVSLTTPVLAQFLSLICVLATCLALISRRRDFNSVGRDGFPAFSPTTSNSRRFGALQVAPRPHPPWGAPSASLARTSPRGFSSLQLLRDPHPAWSALSASLARTSPRGFFPPQLLRHPHPAWGALSASLAMCPPWFFLAATLAGPPPRVGCPVCKSCGEIHRRLGILLSRWRGGAWVISRRESFRGVDLRINQPRYLVFGVPGTMRGKKRSVRIGPRMEVVNISTRTTFINCSSTRRLPWASTVL